MTIGSLTSLDSLGFDPLVTEWFASRFAGPTEPQMLGWPEISAGRDVLISAPTGSGKTLAAFLICLDRLVRAARNAALANETEVLYVSPLKALSNDVHKNLEIPLAEISALAAKAGHSVFADSHRGAYWRHACFRTPANGQASPAHPGDHSRVAVHPADGGQVARDAEDGSNGHRGRNPRRGRRQTRIASGAFSGSIGRLGESRSQASAHRAFGHREADRERS